jgi:hypothetical protein
MRSPSLAFAALIAVGITLTIGPGCGSSDDSTFGHGNGDNGGDDGGLLFGDASFGDDGGGPCTGIACNVVSCPGGGSTTLSGTVFAPTKVNPDPLYNAIVYVPNAPLQPFPAGVSCDKCGTLTSGSPITTALTGPDGKFTLKNVPVGANVPLVVQIGRWRRQVVIPNIPACTDTPVPAELSRLPRNKMEGDIPHHAISTGNADALECVLRKIGVDDAEFTIPTQSGRIHLYDENGATMPNIPSAPSLYGNVPTLSTYDIVIFDCEGSPNIKPTTAQQNVIDYTGKGGRVFASHYSYVWLFNDAPFMGTAQWTPNQPAPGDPLTGILDTTFPKGMAFAQWLAVVNALSGPGQIAIHVPRHDALAVNAPSQRWIYSTSPASLQHYTFNTPVGVADDMQCGRVVFSDFHVTGANGSSGGKPFPTECDNGPLTPQEKVLEFMLFDLASCIQKDTVPPSPPR